MSKKMFLTKVGGALDTDVVNFLTATGIVDTGIITALNDFILDVKSNGLYSRIKAMYVFLGGTSFTHKFNFINPLDTNAAFRLVFSYGFTHSSSGIAPNGTTSFAQTFLVPNTELTNSSGHLFFYSRTDVQGGYDIGASNDPGILDNPVTLICRYGSGLAYATYGYGGYACSISNPDGRGGFMTNRNDGTTTSLWKNGTKIQTANESVNLTTQPLYIGAVNREGEARYFSAKECAYASIGGGFSDAESLIYYNLIQSLQTALGRQF